MHESKQTNEALLALMLPLAFLGLLAGGVVSSLGSLGLVAIGALATACLAMFVGFIMPILALGHEDTLVSNRPQPSANAVPATRTASETPGVVAPDVQKLAA